MPPVAETGGGGWTGGARARHHHRERLRNLGFLALNKTATCASSSTDVEGRQRQQLGSALRATSRWRRGAKRTALAPREGLALEEPRVPRAKPADGRVCVVRSQRGTTTAAAHAACRWRLAKAPSKSSPRTSQRTGARRARSYGTSRSSGWPRVTWRLAAVRPCDADGSSSRATSGDRRRAHGALGRSRAKGPPMARAQPQLARKRESSKNAVLHTGRQRRPFASRAMTAARAHRAASKRFLTEN